jgi:hypothetical protein
MLHTDLMRSVGVGDARRTFSALLDEVKSGREVLITPVLDPPPSASIEQERDDRLEARAVRRLARKRSIIASGEACGADVAGLQR